MRDLLLKRVPKDFDVITTASLGQVLVHSNIMIIFSFPESFDVFIPLTYSCRLQLKKNIFRRSMIVGKRFPICLLKMRGSVIEVCSSYHHHGHMSFLAMHSVFFYLFKQISSFQTGANYQNRSETVDYVEELNGSDDRDILRWKDSMRRDFTING